MVAAAADLADEVGLPNLTMGLLARRLGVRTPSLYKHVESLADVRHRVAVLAMAQLGDVVRAAVVGRSGRAALAAVAGAFRAYVTRHPGRYAATIGEQLTGPDDPLRLAAGCVLEVFAAVLRGYGLRPADLDHALRTLRSAFHGFVTLQSANGFQWAGGPDESYTWMVDFIDRGLRGAP